LGEDVDIADIFELSAEPGACERALVWVIEIGDGEAGAPTPSPLPVREGAV
jgi:hypothetical protein